MRPGRPPRLVALAMLVAALGLGCSKGLVLAPNAPPTLELTSGPIDTSSAHPVAWSVPIAWDARDPDGTISHVRYAVDPPTAAEHAAGAETLWVETKANSVVARFQATRLDSLGPNTTSSDFHVFVARAWDNSGGASEPVVRAFYAYTVAPTAKIERPRPDPFQVLPVPQTFVIGFSGDDPDGIGSREPAGYLLRFLAPPHPLFHVIATDPDSLRREALVTGWRGWTQIPGDRTSFAVENLADGREWVVALAAIDAAGSTTPLFSFDRNLLRVAVSPANGPRLSIRGPGINFSYLDGGSSTDSSRWIPTAFPEGTRPTFSWSAVPAAGRQMAGYRWVLDPDLLSSDVPRADEATDVHRWSRWGLDQVSTDRLPALEPGVHKLYIQAEDDIGGRSLGIVHITAFTLGFERPLLIVNDTRFEPDKPGTGGCPAAYRENWPSAAELDSFLLAVGGVPWRCTVNPAGALSVPGLFAGYGADRVHTPSTDPASVVTLQLLTRYSHVLWLTDFDGAAPEFNNSQGSIPMMRWMSNVTNVRLLEDYSRLGGKVWVAGGGVALASLIDFDIRSNNTTTNMVFTGPDLSTRSFVVSAAHLRSRIEVSRSTIALQRSTAATKTWSGHGPDGTERSPDYSRLPEQLSFRTAATDPLPPTRPPSQANKFYLSTAGLEFAHGSILEEDLGSPGAPRIESVLDTLFSAFGSRVTVAPAPAMFYYHGRDNAPVLSSGFDLWSWTRPDCQALVDFVMQDVWGLTRSGPAASVRAAGPGSALAGERGRRAVRRAR